MSGVTFDTPALRQWAEKRDLPAGDEMFRLFAHLCDDVVASADRIDELEAELRAERYHGPSDTELYGAGAA